jgi:hypothetical protein
MRGRKFSISGSAASPAFSIAHHLGRQMSDQSDLEKGGDAPLIHDANQQRLGYSTCKTVDATNNPVAL